MTKILVALFFSITLLGCKERTAVNQTIKYVLSNQKSINDSLENYFYKYEIEPAIIINNVDGNQTKVSFLNYKIEWLDNGDETKIKIDDDLIGLNDKVTLNNVWGKDVDSVDFANNWDQIKYFKFNDEEIIGIRMSFDPCTGLGCSVDYFLLYDVHRKTKNFFGQFRADRELKLYHYNNNIKVDYISKTYKGDTDGVAEETAIVYELFSLADNGVFVLQKNNQGKPYFIKHTLPVDDTSSIKETLEAQWFEKIK